MDGAAEFELTIEKHGKVEVAGAPPAAANAPASGAAPAPTGGASGTK